MEVDAAILVFVLSFLFPLRLFSFLLRLWCGRSSVGDLQRSGVALAFVAALLAVIYAVPGDRGGHAKELAISEVDDFRQEVRSEIEQLKHQIARLESFLENSSKTLDDKANTADEECMLMKAMGLDIQSLINEQENIKESLSSSYSKNNIRAMENEVQVLKDESRKMNSNFYKVWSLAKDVEKKVESLYSDIKKGFKHKRSYVPFSKEW